MKKLILWLLISCAVVFPLAGQDKPPLETGKRAPELVELVKLDANFRLDIRYATKNNFAKQRVYQQARAFLQKPAAEALMRVSQKVREQGYGLLIFDGYRPWRVTKLFYDITPPELKKFVADPAKGSRHNRGCAVDLSLYDLKTGREARMPSEYDEMTERAHVNYSCAPDEAKRLRDLLRAAMEREGFAVYEEEWWHFDYRDWREYPILNVPFERLP